MPHDVIMPALGMAQDSGTIVAWRKSAGDAVAEGDVLFEVETDKATMEIEAPAAGFLIDVSAAAGDEVPIGQVIARIGDMAESTGDRESTVTAPTSGPAPAAPETLPDGQPIIMPTLGMAQDSGLLVRWLKDPGAAVAADDVLFEVETDKSVMEVPAGFDGYLAARLATAGDTIPIGTTIAVIAQEKPDRLIDRPYDGEPETRPAKPSSVPTPTVSVPEAAGSHATGATKAPAPTNSDGRILASPKARRLAKEQGLDLRRLVDTGVPQPYHAKDIETLKSLPDIQSPSRTSLSVNTGRRLVAEIERDGFAEFAEWAAEEAGIGEPSAILAGMAAASLGEAIPVAIESFGQTRTFAAGARLGAVSASEDTPSLLVRDLRHSLVTSVEAGPEAVPVLTLLHKDLGLTVTLECDADQLSVSDAIQLLSNFAGRIENPLRHLL